MSIHNYDKFQLQCTIRMHKIRIQIQIRQDVQIQVRSYKSNDKFNRFKYLQSFAEKYEPSKCKVFLFRFNPKKNTHFKFSGRFEKNPYLLSSQCVFIFTCVSDSQHSPSPRFNWFVWILWINNNSIREFTKYTWTISLNYEYKEIAWY